MIKLKSADELKKMRASGQIVSRILRQVASAAKPGVTLAELDRLAEELTREAGARPAFKGFHGYKHVLCTSVNEQVVHGIPTDRKLADGDIVGLDFGVVLDGYYGDSAVTVPIGQVGKPAQALMKATCNGLYAAIDAARPGNSLKDIGRAVEQAVKPFNFGIVREFVGHGIGQSLHEDPQVPNYEDGASNIRLRAGMTIAIEPMITAGARTVRILDDRWTAVTTDGSLSAHFEHTIAITENEAEILTEWDPPKFGSVFNNLN